MPGELQPFLICLLLMVIGGCGSHTPAKDAVPSVNISKAFRQTISQTISGEAELFAYQEADLAPKISSPIQKYLVQRGENVKKGQLLAVLENRDLASALAEAQGAYDEAQANYETTLSANLPQQLRQAESDLTNAKANLQAQQKLYENRLALYSQGAMARRDVDVAAVGLTQARNNYQIALSHLSDLKSVTTKQTKKLASGQLESARAKESAAKAQLQYTEIRSPINGLVASRNYHQGDIVPTGSPLITVMDVSQIIAKLHLPQDQSALVKVGDAATLQTAGFNHAFPGKVTVLSPALDPNSTTSEVWVEARNPDSRLQVGSSVDVVITVKTVSDAIVIPSSSIINISNKTEVMLVGAGNQVHRQAVTIGITAGHLAQVTHGLQVGQSVITTGGYGLPDGTKVQPAPNTESGSQTSTE